MFLLEYNVFLFYLSVAYLSGANLPGYLSGVNLSGVNLTGVNLSGKNLSGANLSGAKLSGTDLLGTALSGTALSGADLKGANLTGADLKGAYLRGANLRGANLSRVRALRTNFDGATLTGACIQDWNINSETNLENVICDYVYLRQDQQERRPHDLNRNFEPGEFTKLFQKALETVDLVFLDGIDWKAFLLSLKELQNEYGQENVDVQGIEKRPGGTFVVRIDVPPEVNKAEIESKAKQSYETQLKIIEAEHRAELRSLEAHYQDKIIKLHEKQGSDMMEIAKLLASRPYYISKKQRGLLGVLYI
ncbi:pentapeptide repeat-containing protein [Crocosphaera watsonii]|uniref:pentapeptide repeat-containing protein n=1 Tax=Crocosphaera watsonii TaxID=263511 RepID=UPI0030D9E1E2